MTELGARQALSSEPVRGQITKESIASAQAMIGTYLRPEGPFLQDVTNDTIRNFCNGAGDLNPLFRDLEHGRASRFGSVVAHPLMPQCYGYVGQTRWGFPGVHGFFAGGDWEFFRQWYPGDRISCVERVVGVEMKQSKHSAQLALQYTEGSFFNQRGDLMARVLGWCTRHERGAVSTVERKATTGDSVGAPKYSPEELDRIQELELAESTQIRGKITRYWEEVSIGEKLPDILRGPLSVMDLEAFNVGVGRGRASGLLLQDALRRPKHYFRDSESGALEHTGQTHKKASLAKAVGAPAGYDYGPQRISWLVTLVCNWMGDAAFLKRIRGEVRRFNALGDLTTCSGTVVRKYELDRNPMVDIEIQATNQRGEVTAPGLATVILPSRDIRTRPVWDGAALELGLPTIR